MQIADLRDFEFALRWLEADSLFDRPQFANFSTNEAMAFLTLAEQLSVNELAPHLRASDTREPTLDREGAVSVLPEVARAVRAIADAGFFGAPFDEALGGLQAPHLLHTAALGLLMGGNISIASFLLLTVANARLLSAYGSAAQIDAFAKPQVAGIATGTMCLSEPHAGSSLADIRTRAIYETEDALGARYRLFGDKMWISAGDHDATGNIIHLVLAKTPQEDGSLPAGTQDISLFVVPKILPDGHLNDIEVAGLNHKMGYRGIPNCALNFGQGRQQPHSARGAVGWLLGSPGRGLAQMFQMMNEARVSVGLGATMLAYRGFQASLAYARERTQGRAKGAAPSDPPSPIIRHADVKRMLLTQKAYTQGALGLLLYCARLIDDERTAETDEQRAVAGELLGLLTPIAKTWPSEWGQASLHHALQVHGGAGYTRDFEVELLYRDNRLNPIHEGTTGIQALDLIKRKIRRDNGSAFHLLRTHIQASIEAARAQSPDLRASATALEEALRQVDHALPALLGDEELALAHATTALFAIGHMTIGWVWLSQATFAQKLLELEPAADRAFLRGRVRACRYFAEHELPLVSAWLAPLRNGDRTVLDLAEDEL